MLPIFIRAFSTVITVVIAVIVSATLGDSASGKIWAAVFIAAAIAIVEWLLIWTPKHFAYARRLLDPRARHLGVWLQVVRRVVSTIPSSEDQNAFAIYWVDYHRAGYCVTGFAFDAGATEHSRWRSKGSPDFAPDGQSMTYLWVGEVVGDENGSDDIERTGVAHISLPDRTGRVDHVGLSRILLFDIEEVSPALLSELGLADVTLKRLREASTRNRFAEHFAANRFADAGGASQR